MTQRLFELSALHLGSAYAQGELSPVEVVTAVLERIETVEPAINAMFLVDREGAVRSAEEAQRRWRAGSPLSPLDGVPITIKDNIAVRGMPAPVGTAAADHERLSLEDSPPTARVREAGCVILGKTTMPDLGMLASGVSSLHGVTRNPWIVDANTWGSSSGAAAGLAAGYGPLALGTDIGGSVRLPAAACGVFALKPSLGRVPIHPPYWGRVTGPMTRTVRDTALLMTVLTRPDARDFMSLPPDQAEYGALDPAAIKGLRLGLMLDIGAGIPVEPAVRQAVEAAARLLEGAGAVVIPAPPLPDAAVMLGGLDRFFRIRAATDHLGLPAERRARLLPFVRQWLEAAFDWSAVEAFRALNEVPRLREAAVQATAPFDYLLTPTTPIAAYPAELPCPSDNVASPLWHIAFTAPFNQSEQPACSIPCGFTADGMPIGLQIVGHRFDDLGVLRLAAAYEALRALQVAWPEPVAD